MEHVIHKRENCFTGNFAVRDPGVSSDHKYVNQVTSWDGKSEIQPAECGEILLHFMSVNMSWSDVSGLYHYA